MFYFANAGEGIKAVMCDGHFIGNLEDIDGDINFKGTGIGKDYRLEIIEKYRKEYQVAEKITTKIIRKK